METKKLTCCDLMVGDWVKLNYKGKSVKVKAIHDGLIDTTAVSPLKDDEYEPIPLTREILWKNGFKLHAISEIYELVSPKKDWFVAIGFKDGCIDWCKVHRWGDEYLGSIKYIHKLQHALRLCGIDKEIKL